ncbi:MAG: diguanylate cyclase, partial [Deltaproteobacteria bacterium]|nr:diguanylate cyclase [Deltaproteobacteria bacterium]
MDQDPSPKKPTGPWACPHEADLNTTDANILVVDDDAAVTDTLRDYLLREGYRTRGAYDSPDALQILESEPVDLVLTDIVLPSMDGLALAEKVRTRYGADVMLMTGYSSEYRYEQVVEKWASDFLVKPVQLEELRLRVRRVLRERRLLAAYEESLAECRRLAVTDGLTGLYNSRHFYRILDTEIHRSLRYGHPLSLLLADLDRFKAFNDRFGHIEGDRVLSRVADAIRSCLRRMDTAFRYGGEEFTVLLPETAVADAAIVAERIRAAIGKLT